MGCDNGYLKPKKLGFSLGIVWGVFVIIVGWIAGLTQLSSAANFVSVLGQTYIGYEATLLGGLIGGLWGFIILFFFGWFVAKVYNYSSGGCQFKSDCCTAINQNHHHDLEKGVGRLIVLFLFGWLIAKFYSCCFSSCRSSSDSCKTPKRKPKRPTATVKRTRKAKKS